jgi:hypothetical protein
MRLSETATVAAGGGWPVMVGEGGIGMPCTRGGNGAYDVVVAAIYPGACDITTSTDATTTAAS